MSEQDINEIKQRHQNNKDKVQPLLPQTLFIKMGHHEFYLSRLPDII
jgi:hypothetical protein